MKGVIAVMLVAGIALVSAEISADNLSMALKELLGELESQNLDLEARDSLGLCNKDTAFCNNNGECQRSRRFAGSYYCVCDPGFKVDTSGSCSALTKREFALLDMSLRNTQGLCELETKDCNGLGECVQSRYGGWRCACDNPILYTINQNGGCVPRP